MKTGTQKIREYAAMLPNSGLGQGEERVDRDRRRLLIRGTDQDQWHDERTPRVHESEDRRRGDAGHGEGMTTRRRTWKVLARSMRAASSRSVGTASMKFFMR